MHIATIYIHESIGAAVRSGGPHHGKTRTRSAPNTLTETNKRYCEAKQAHTYFRRVVTSRSNVTGQDESDEAAGQSHSS